jgi:hypothetical protein
MRSQILAVALLISLASPVTAGGYFEAGRMIKLDGSTIWTSFVITGFQTLHQSRGFELRGEAQIEIHANNGETEALGLAAVSVLPSALPGVWASVGVGAILSPQWRDWAQSHGYRTTFEAVKIGYRTPPLKIAQMEFRANAYFRHASRIDVGNDGLDTFNLAIVHEF